jgi:hypothetical protein
MCLNESTCFSVSVEIPVIIDNKCDATVIIASCLA